MRLAHPLLHFSAHGCPSRSSSGGWQTPQPPAASSHSCKGTSPKGSKVRLPVQRQLSAGPPAPPTAYARFSARTMPAVLSFLCCQPHRVLGVATKSLSPPTCHLCLACRAQRG